VQGRFAVELGERVDSASLQDGRVVLELLSGDRSHSLTVDHVLASTGYRVAVSSLDFLERDLRTQIACEGTAPRLRATFESSVPGLYFAGLAAAPTFGPLMRFVAGTGFSARTISAAVAR
jgi:thioredoxin reductase